MATSFSPFPVCSLPWECGAHEQLFLDRSPESQHLYTIFPSSLSRCSQRRSFTRPGTRSPQLCAPSSCIVRVVGANARLLRDSIPLSSAGLGITVILPSAFVAFPAGETDSLPTRARTRIISAGAFHNLLLWAFLSFLAWMPISDVVWPVLGYRNVRGYGRVVVGVDVVSSTMPSTPSESPHTNALHRTHPFTITSL